MNMKTVLVPTDADLEDAARTSYERRLQRLKDRDQAADWPAWGDLDQMHRDDEIAKMRAAHIAGPHVAERLGLRSYSAMITVPEIGQTVIYEGWPAVVTMTRDSAMYAAEPLAARAALPELRTDLHVHLHVLSAPGPRPAYAVDHGADGWLWPDEAATERERFTRKARSSEAAA